MQYLLSEEEYNELKAAPEKIRKEKDKIIQRLCVEVAEHKPVKFWGEEEAQPWGCRLRRDDPMADYCDNCPVQDVCPSDDKRWSK